VTGRLRVAPLGAWLPCHRPPAGEHAARVPKLEGRVIPDPQHVAIVNDNDNDLALHDRDRPQRSLLIIARLPQPLIALKPLPCPGRPREFGRDQRFHKKLACSSSQAHATGVRMLLALVVSPTRSRLMEDTVWD